MTGRERLAQTARDLKVRHGALLTRECSFDRPDADRAVDAIGEAQRRVLGDRRRAQAPEGQLALDLAR